MQAKAIEFSGRPAGSGRFPMVCAPLVGRTRDNLLAEVAIVAAKKPDILEWRVDFFEGLGDTARVVELAAGIQQAAAGIPVLFTRRSSREGGEKIALAEEQVVGLYRAVCASGHVDMVDYEMSNEPAQVDRVRQMARDQKVKLILSFHDFQRTPSLDFLAQRFDQAQRLGADIAKVAVMPRDMQDVLSLLAATLQASERLAIPVVSMSMGALGAVTRLCGWTFGSAMTFAVGANSSAPGQMPIEDIDAGLAVVRKALGKSL